ncbi:hypothetical protein PoB_003098400 [Plakobranchus ocellatus]|uniref:Uncharacterized protein n=1 Tax=Plakobranchus ocellatus TaxID=259542 RepID=A0AAV4ADI9_9GAST|nr:hypothetical protein PoB_003098400 [Plakobranchus ocellatus]
MSTTLHAVAAEEEIYYNPVAAKLPQLSNFVDRQLAVMAFLKIHRNEPVALAEVDEFTECPPDRTSSWLLRATSTGLSCGLLRGKEGLVKRYNLTEEEYWRRFQFCKLEEG